MIVTCFYLITITNTNTKKKEVVGSWHQSSVQK